MNRIRIRLVFSLLVVLPLAACSSGGTIVPTSSPTDFALTSNAFSEGGAIPQQYTCDGAGDSPELAWVSPPEGTQSFALIARDPDAPGGDFVHWVVYGIPADITGLPSSQAGLMGVGRGGENSAGRPTYAGPCPPFGTHHYYFTLYALDSDLNFDTPPRAIDVAAAMEGHILGQAVLMGTYQR